MHRSTNGSPLSGDAAPKAICSGHPAGRANASFPPVARKISASPVHNRIRALLAHTTRYAFKGESRLAKDSGVSRSALNRVVSGQSSPSFALVSAITRILERSLGCRIDPHDVVSLDGTYPTPLVCGVMGCHGCLPDFAYDAGQNIKPEWQGVAPGQWSGSVGPNDTGQKAVPAPHPRSGPYTSALAREAV